MDNKRFQEILDSIKNVKQHRDENIFIVDGTNTFIRNFTAINHLNINGHHIGGLTGALKSIGYGIKITQPTRVIVLFDGVGGSNTKKNLYADYKGNRSIGKIMNYKMFDKKDDELESMTNQMGRLLNYLDCLPITLISIDGIEADDVIGHLVEEYENNSNTKKITIMSADRDFLQLLSPKTFVYSPTKKIVYNEKKFFDEFGVHAQNYLIYKTLLGDKGDNVPKVPGFGKDKLIKLLPEILEPEPLELQSLLESLDPNDKWGAKILAFSHQLDINYQIMSLKSVPLTPGDLAEINQNLTEANRDLDKMSFLRMYYADALNNSIPYVENWLTDVFGYLANFKEN